MPLAAIDFLAGIIAVHASPFGCFHRLAVHTSRARLAFPSDSFPHISSQLIMNPLPVAVLPPNTEIMVSDFPRRQIVRQHPPCSAAAHLIEDSTHDLTPRILGGSTTRLHRRNQRLDAVPLLLGQIGRVRLTFFHSF